MNPGQPSLIGLSCQGKAGWGIKMKDLTRVSVRAVKTEKENLLRAGLPDTKDWYVIVGPSAKWECRNSGSISEKLKMAMAEHETKHGAILNTWPHVSAQVPCQRSWPFCHLQPHGKSTTLYTLWGNESYFSSLEPQHYPAQCLPHFRSL